MFKLKVKYLDNDKLTLNSDFNNKIYEEEVVNIDFRDIKVDECTFKKIDFSSSTFTDMEFMDTTFEDCILTNKCFDNMIFTRCIFKNCKLLGSSFCDSDINCMQIDNCVSTYCNFSGSKIKELYMKNQELLEYKNDIIIVFPCERIQLEGVKFLFVFMLEDDNHYYNIQFYSNRDINENEDELFYNYDDLNTFIDFLNTRVKRETRVVKEPWKQHSTYKTKYNS